MKTVLILCEGNICRSPMAQGFFADALPSTSVQSAGLGALVGSPADETAVKLMLERGIDIRFHRAQQVSRPLCKNTELILVMEKTQRARLQDLYPETRGRVFRLGEFTESDIPDPYRKGESAFHDALSQIEESTHEWLRRINRL